LSVTVSLFRALPIEVWVITILSLIGGILIIAQKAHIFSGYEEIAPDVREIAADFRAQISRGGEDLVVSGNRNGVPTTLRFSHAENTPAFIARGHAPVNFNLQVARKGRRFAGEGALLRLDNPRLNKFLVCCTTDLVQAKIFLGFPAVQTELEKLPWSANTLLTFSVGRIELTEPALPPDLADYVLNQCNSISILAEECRKMPNAGEVNVARIPREKAWVLRSALAAGVLVSVAIMPFRSGKAEGASPVISQSIEGIEAGDSKIIRDARNWRLGKDEDMELSFLAWIDPQGNGGHFKFSMDADGKHESNDKAYLLTSEKSSNIKRVVWIADRRLVYDYVGPLIGVAKVPRDEMDHMRWSEAGTPKESPDGDGLLVVREYGTPNGASIFFLHDGVLCSGTPADYRSLSLN
jgi:hypothetical protein